MTLYWRFTIVEKGQKFSFREVEFRKLYSYFFILFWDNDTNRLSSNSAFNITFPFLYSFKALFYWLCSYFLKKSIHVSGHPVCFKTKNRSLKNVPVVLSNLISIQNWIRDINQQMKQSNYHLLATIVFEWNPPLFQFARKETTKKC